MQKARSACARYSDVCPNLMRLGYSLRATVGATDIGNAQANTGYSEGSQYRRGGEDRRKQSMAEPGRFRDIIASAYVLFIELDCVSNGRNRAC